MNIYTSAVLINIHGVCGLQRTLPCQARVIKNRVANVYDKSQLSLKVTVVICLSCIHAHTALRIISVGVGQLS